MVTIVRDHASGVRFVLLGTGFGAFSSRTPGEFLGNLSPNERKGTHTMLAVCGPSGNVVWYPSTAMQVISVAGRHPAELLQQPGMGGTVARDRASGTMLVVLGTGYGAFANATPSAFWGNRKPKYREGAYAMVAVCDAAGQIGWLASEALEIVQVDGRPLASLLGTV